MQTQRRELEMRLECEGWRVVDRDPEPNWWADEIWTVESTWHPVGFQVWASFLVDPMHSGLRRKGEHVWAVAINSQRPQDPGDANSSAFPIRRHWSESLDKLTGTAQSIRENAVKNEEAG